MFVFGGAGAFVANLIVGRIGGDGQQVILRESADVVDGLCVGCGAEAAGDRRGARN
jgi:hypothetical protein